MKRISWILCLSFCLVKLYATELHLEIEHCYDGKPIQLSSELNSPDSEFEVTRWDWLISDLDLQRADGTWLESEGWVEYISVGDNRRRAIIWGVPQDNYQAIRFLVGLNQQQNEIDENQIPPDSALHPIVNGLHWGWEDGYIFSAVEGRFGKENEGFSYHLATTGNAVEIVLPVNFNSPSHSTISMAVDLKPLFSSIRLGVDPTSSHSRDQDPLIEKMQAALKSAFQITSLSSDKYQQPKVTESDAPKQDVYGTPFSLPISSRLPTVELPQDNPLTVEAISLGKVLFSDKRLSGNDSQSCASCHHPDKGFVDPDQAFSVGSEGIVGKMNSMPLFNLAWHDRFFWDGRVNSLRKQVLLPIEDPTEMNQDLKLLISELSDDKALLKQFESAFGTAEINETRIAMALEQFLLTLISQDSKFDRAARGEVKLTSQETRGLQLFVTEFDPERNQFGADCFHCHGGNLFTNRRFTNNGLPNQDHHGLFNTTGEKTDKGKFKTPSLRNIALTAPYMHDGRFSTLEQVVDHYSNGVHRSEHLDPNLAKHPAEGIQLSQSDKAALIAFLHTLTDDKFGSSD